MALALSARTVWCSTASLQRAHAQVRDPSSDGNGGRVRALWGGVWGAGGASEREVAKLAGAQSQT